jgi:hypothetical protein
VHITTNTALTGATYDIDGGQPVRGRLAQEASLSSIDRSNQNQPRTPDVSGNERGARMSTIHMHQTTTLTPEQYIAGLTDFGSGRAKLFGNSTDEYMKVHSRGPAQADVTEGSSGIWERLHYDWSDPNHVVLKTTDSTWGGASGHTYTFTRRPDGLTDIDLVTVRDGKNLKGWLIGVLVGTIGKGVLEKAFQNSVKAIEARNGTARERSVA